MMKKIIFLSTVVLTLGIVSCSSIRSVGSKLGSILGTGSKMAKTQGGEVTGISGTPMNEPTPYGMVLIQRGSIKGVVLFITHLY